MMARTLLGLGVLVLTATAGFGATIDVGDFLLAPNTADQQIQIVMIGTAGIDETQGATVNIQIADGYPDVPGSTTNGPDITAVDLVSASTIFGSVPNQGMNLIEQRDQIWVVGTSTQSGTVLANGVLAIVTVDTTGWFAGDGPWELRLTDTFNGDTNFQSPAGPLTVTITNGAIAVPEPSALTLALVSGLFALSFSRLNPATRRQVRPAGL